MRYLLLFCINLSSLLIVAQEPQEIFFFLEGYVCGEDSLPVEGAYVISYRTTKITTTDSYGHFKILIEDGDSLMISHISLVPMIIHAKKENRSINKLFIPYRIYSIESLSNNDFQKERKYAVQNMIQINKEIINTTLVDSSLQFLNVNPYDDDKISQGIDLRGFFKLLRKHRKSEQ